ncbi:sodium/potassium/calcium exchanger 4-like [Prorops nasuta]|uniref:sodium/potassium/calcium exchanger 4-like n=1 Tax=Prorops nasuta TaxID=863751 RepID=UPI0034CE00A7
MKRWNYYGSLAILLFLLYTFVSAGNPQFNDEDSITGQKKTVPLKFGTNVARSFKFYADSSPSPKAENCTAPSIDEFPDDLFTKEQRHQGAVFLHTFFAFYCFLLTAHVCNNYLLPCLDLICTDMGISADVAGATFLATASCFPELFVNVVGTFLTESDLGVGTVVGGAVWNTFMTPACGALAAVHGIPVEWTVLSRDCVIYVISVGTLALVMWDGIIKWYEAAILMILFFGYLAILFSGKTLAKWYKRIFWNGSAISKAEPSKDDDAMPEGLYRPYFHGELIIDYKRKSSARKSIKANGKLNDLEKQESIESLEDYVEPDTPFVIPVGTQEKAWFLFTWPLKIVLFVTIPDIRYKRLRNWYPLTFIMCVTWIAISSYIVSWMVTVIGDTIGISDSIMGITFLSAGGNMPEMTSIVILARQGQGDMGISNAIGANTLDILLCLALPWLIKTLMTGRDVRIVSGALGYSILSVIVCVIGFYVAIVLCKFRLNKKVGVACLLMYLIFLAFSVMIELNVFFHVNWPQCDS